MKANNFSQHQSIVKNSLGRCLSTTEQRKLRGGKYSCGTGCYLASTDCGNGPISYVCCPSGPTCDCEMPC